MGELFIPRRKIYKPCDLGGGKHRVVLDPTLPIQPSAKDTFLWLFQPDTNCGSLTDLRLQNRSITKMRAILEFDISGLPAGVTLDAASLQLYYYHYDPADPVGKTVWAYKLTRTDWVELQATWNIYKTGSNWASAGGDYVTSDPAGDSTVFPADYGWMTWGVLPIVQDAYDGSVAAEFLVKYADETLVSGYTQSSFHSNNYTGDTSLCPKLVIDYTVPAVGRSFGYIMG